MSYRTFDEENKRIFFIISTLDLILLLKLEMQLLIKVQNSSYQNIFINILNSINEKVEGWR